MEFVEVKSEYTQPKFFCLIENITNIGNRTAVLDYLTIRERPYLNIPEELIGKPMIKCVTDNKEELAIFDGITALHVYKSDEKIKDLTKTTPTDKTHVYGVVTVKETDVPEVLLVLLTSNGLEAPFKQYERFQLLPGMIDNYNDDTPIITDVGKFIVNQIILVFPFGDKVPYINKRFDAGEVDDIVAKMILDKKIGRKEYDDYMNWGYWYGSDGSKDTATWSVKTITTDPNIAKRKAELFAQHEHELDNPLVIAAIERELIAMDKNYTKNDPGTPFLFVNEKKNFTEVRKKQFVMCGLITAFDRNSGRYEFVPETLSDGWSLKNLDKAANEVRRGSYGRGVETAKGGEQTKFVLRIFQNTEIVEEDCGSKQGMPILITDKNYKKFYGRYFVDGKQYTEENAKSFIGKVIVLRSPMACKSANGFCYKCCGELFKKVDIKVIGVNSILITSGFTSTAMKSMHVSGVQLHKIENFHRFLREK